MFRKMILKIPFLFFLDVIYIFRFPLHTTVRRSCNIYYHFSNEYRHFLLLSHFMFRRLNYFDNYCKHSNIILGQVYTPKSRNLEIKTRRIEKLKNRKMEYLRNGKLEIANWKSSIRNSQRTEKFTNTRSKPSVQR